MLAFALIIQQQEEKETHTFRRREQHEIEAQEEIHEKRQLREDKKKRFLDLRAQESFSEEMRNKEILQRG